MLCVCILAAVLALLCKGEQLPAMVQILFTVDGDD